MKSHRSSRLAAVSSSCGSRPMMRPLTAPSRRRPIPTRGRRRSWPRRRRCSCRPRHLPPRIPARPHRRRAPSRRRRPPSRGSQSRHLPPAQRPIRSRVSPKHPWPSRHLRRPQPRQRPRYLPDRPRPWRRRAPRRHRGRLSRPASTAPTASSCWRFATKPRPPAPGAASSSAIRRCSGRCAATSSVRTWATRHSSDCRRGRSPTARVPTSVCEALQAEGADCFVVEPTS